MKKLIQPWLRALLCSVTLILLSISAHASHVVGADLFYKWISGNTYKITVVLYGDCGLPSRPVFAGLPTGTPEVCIYDGPTNVATIRLPIEPPSAGVEVSPVCPRMLDSTQCTNTAYATPGIKKFVYSMNYTLPRTSRVWRFIYTGDNGSQSSGRAAALDNIVGGTTVQLIDTLNNLDVPNNSSPVLTVEPVPFFCNDNTNCYNPGAVDLYDTNYLTRPAGDSLMFSLIPATNGSGSCAIGGPVGYVGTAWLLPTVQMVSGPTPLRVHDYTFFFDPRTGQLCFHAYTQRAVVVYNIREYRGPIMVGTMQREMSFLVLPCTTTAPTGGIDSFTTTGGDTTDSHHFVVCGNSGPFSLHINPREADTSNHITVTATGLPPGSVFVVDSNGTSHPHVHFSWITTTGVVQPGDYVFYITAVDDHCPTVGSKTYAFSITIYPVPTIRDSVIAPATCARKAAFYVIPGGTGKPWRIKVSDVIGDTIQSFVDTTSFIDSLPPGSYHLTIFSDVTNQCAVDYPFRIDTPRITSPARFTSPTYCGARDGSIVVSLLNPGDVDTMFYNYNTTPQPGYGFVVEADGTDTLRGLLAGVYDNIVIKSGYCLTRPAGPLNLTNPPFTLRTITGNPPAKCGYCDGEITIYGLHPGQLDTLSYTIGGVPTTATAYIGADSIMKLTALCESDYNSFFVHTAGVCTTATSGLIPLRAPAIRAGYNFSVREGCSGDTVLFTNSSTPAAELTYKWYFGDGTTDTATNPRHIYRNTKGASYNVQLIITNGKCVDSLTQTVNLNNFIDAGFTISPYPYVCQGSPVTFTDTSTGTSPTFAWYFGDGKTDNNFNTSHVYANTGTYNIMLIAGNSVPCFDTAYGVITVDSISPIKILATDTVICRGQEVTFTGLFTTIGKTEVIWDFGDGTTMKNVNPVLHSFDNTGALTIKADVNYRACPSLVSTKSIRVFPVPDMYLGEDKAICPGGEPIKITDERNSANPGARWKWSTGETGPSIVVNKPGTYTAVVNIDGCTTSDTVWVANDCYVSMPSVFTPNGDGVNDFFFPRTLLTKGLTSFKMSIYNRWGQLIFESSTVEGQGWDGSLNNTPQPQGVYIYKIEAKFKDGQIESHQGNITLLR